MDADDVLEILTALRRIGGEPARVEAKRAAGGLPKSLRETLSAFSNSDGGTVLLGVDEDEGFATVPLTDPDNAWAYRWSLRETVALLDARHIFIRPHCPWQDGKVERLNRTLATAWAYRQVFTSNAERPCPWLEHYNTRRRHTALGGLPPVSRPSPT